MKELIDKLNEQFNEAMLLIEKKDQLIEFYKSELKKVSDAWEEAATKNYADKCEIEKLVKQNIILRKAIYDYRNDLNFKDDDLWQALKDVEGVG